MGLGAIFRFPAMVIYMVGGLWGFVLCLGIIAKELGTVFAIVAFFLAPVTVAVAPWYEGLSNENWFPLILIYGGGITAAILNGIGAAIDGE